METVFLSELASIQLRKKIEDKGCYIIDICETESVYKSIAAHPDIYLCIIDNTVIISKEQLPHIKSKLKKYNINYITGTKALKQKYPDTIHYNALEIGCFFVHQLKHTDQMIMEKVKQNQSSCINVKQGYTKCNICVVNDNSIITSDEGIAKELKKNGIDVLLIEAGYVKLDGFEYGFIGGASGKIGDTILFNGNLSDHPDAQKIRSFIEKKGFYCEDIPEYPLTDIGSIITYKKL